MLARKEAKSASPLTMSSLALASSTTPLMQFDINAEELLDHTYSEEKALSLSYGYAHINAEALGISHDGDRDKIGRIRSNKTESLNGVSTSYQIYSLENHII
jgi:phosphomannomutase